MELRADVTRDPQFAQFLELEGEERASHPNGRFLLLFYMQLCDESPQIRDWVQDCCINYIMQVLESSPQDLSTLIRSALMTPTDEMWQAVSSKRHEVERVLPISMIFNLMGAGRQPRSFECYMSFFAGDIWRKGDEYKLGKFFRRTS